MTYKTGEVVVVKFPFTNQQGTKQRPAVIVSSNEYNASRPDIILMAVTSQIKHPLGFAEAIIEDWQGAGLLKPSVFKPVIFTAEKELVRKSLGQLSYPDYNTLQRALDTMLYADND